MHLTRILLTTLAALTLAALPATASAHDGNHPFKTCAEAYDNGYAKISSGDDHYGPALDPDGDGVACDQPPAGFIPRDDTEVDGATTPVADTTPAATSDAGSDDGLTTYVIIGVSAVVLVGGAALVASRRRRAA